VPDGFANPELHPSLLLVLKSRINRFEAGICRVFARDLSGLADLWQTGHGVGEYATVLFTSACRKFLFTRETEMVRL
jgi:hypothetical protein